MNINYIIGIVGALGVFLFGCITNLSLYPEVVFEIVPQNLWNFFDAASILITMDVLFHRGGQLPWVHAEMYAEALQDYPEQQGV